MVKPYQWIETQSQLDNLSSLLMKEELIALDAEMDQHFAYFPSLCLLQISTRLEHYLVDTLAKLDWSSLNAVFSSSKVLKVFHAGENDIPFLKHFLGSSFKQVQDTQVLANFLKEERLSLSFLVERYCDIRLEKNSQISDWRLRPLSEKQCEYAVGDTAHLIQLYEALAAKVSDEDWESLKPHWLKLTNNTWKPKRKKPYAWQKVKGSHRLSQTQKRNLAALYWWREYYAVACDEAPHMVIKNSRLLKLARIDNPTVEAISEVLPKENAGLASDIQKILERVADYPSKTFLKKVSSFRKCPPEEGRTLFE